MRPLSVRVMVCVYARYVSCVAVHVGTRVCDCVLFSIRSVMLTGL